MLIDLWRDLPSGGRIGVVVAMVGALSLAPFLTYAGIAIMNIVAQRAQSVVGDGLSVVVAVATFGAYAGLVFFVVFLAGGLLGVAVQRLYFRATKRGA